MSFKTEYMATYRELMAEATADGSPYDLTKQFVTDEFNNFNITEKEKAEMLANFVASITTNITTAAMQAALSISDKAGKYDDEAANVKKQGQMLDAQIAKVDADTSYVETQEEKLVEQVEHNKYIKAMDSMGDMIGTVGAGGLKPTATMWDVYFSANNYLTGFSNPANPDLTPAV